MRQKSFNPALLFLAVLACGSCDLPEAPDFGKGSVTLRLPRTSVAAGSGPGAGSGPSRAVLSNSFTGTLVYRITLTGPGGTMNLEAGGGGTSVRLDPGEWSLRATAHDPANMAVTVGEGAASFTVTRGRDRKVPVSMKVDPAYENALLDFYLHSEADLRRVGKDLPVDITRTYYLENDIVLEQPWVPIGVDITAPFGAAFDGQGHTVTIKSFDTSAGPDYVGFFGYVKGSGVSGYPAVIRDLTILYNGPPVDMTYSAGPRIGLVAGYAEDTLFQDLRVRGNLSATSTITTGPAFYMGGVAGYGNSVTITNCHVSGNVIGDVNHILVIGGITGSVAGTSLYASVIVNTSFTGGVYGSVTGDDCIAGGITGYISGPSNTTVITSYASAKVEAFGNNAYAGGIAGELRGVSGNKTIENCYAWAEVKADGAAAAAAAAAGGIAGRSDASANTIENCYARGRVEAAGASTRYAGGIVGDNNAGTIEYCAALNGTISIGGAPSPSAVNRVAGKGAYGINSNWVSDPDTGFGTTFTNPTSVLNGMPNEHPETDFQSPGIAYDSSYLNWNFISSWTWISGYPYPALYWQDSPPRNPGQL